MHSINTSHRAFPLLWLVTHVQEVAKFSKRQNQSVQKTPFMYVSSHEPPGVRAVGVMDMAKLQRILEIAKEKRSFFRKMLKKKKKREFKA